MEKILSTEAMLCTVQQDYPALYECNCSFLTRELLPFRAQTEEYVSWDLRILANSFVQQQKMEPFVLLFHRVGGCLAEARLLLLLRAQYHGPLRIIVTEPLFGKNSAVTAALTDFERLVLQLTGAHMQHYATLKAYAMAVQRGETLRATAIVILDSDEPEDVCFTFDNKVNRELVARFAKRCCSLQGCYFARLAADGYEGSVLGHLHRSFFVQQPHLLLYQFFHFGEQQFVESQPLVWLQGEQIYPFDFVVQHTREEEDVEVRVAVKNSVFRFFEEQSFLFVQDL